MIRDAVKDQPSAGPDGAMYRNLIDGVDVREHKNLVTKNGITTEIHRADWGFVEGSINHIIFVEIRAGVVSAWHMHEIRTDYIFVISGAIRIVLFDDREASATHGNLNVFNSSMMRPTVYKIPPGVWHGFKNLDNQPGGFLNFSDHAYNYAEPDEWRLPADSQSIPYAF